MRFNNLITNLKMKRILLTVFKHFLPPRILKQVLPALYSKNGLDINLGVGIGHGKCVMSVLKLNFSSSKLYN
jgi:hypothetical protein